MKMTHPKIDKGFGFEMINGLYELIKKALKTIASKENMLENPSITISHDDNYSNLEEMELLVKTEISAYKKLILSISLFKWITILVESIGSYMVVGLLMHPMNLKEVIDDKSIIYLIQWGISFAISTAIATLAVYIVKRKSEDSKFKFGTFILALSCYFIMPLVALLFVSFSKYEIDNKEIYFVSLFFTVFSGTLLVLRCSSLSKKEEKRQKMLRHYQKAFGEIKNEYNKAKNLYLQIFKQNNNYDGFLEDFNSIDENKSLYAPLKQFLKESSEKGFDIWSEEYIERQKSKHLLSRKKTSTNSIPG